MVAHCLYTDGVKSFPINKIVFVCAGRLNPHGPVDAANLGSLSNNDGDGYKNVS